MKAYDLMKLAAENPQKYEGKRYRAVQQDFYVCGMDKTVEECVIRNSGFYSDDKFVFACAIAHNTELEEIAQPVSFTVAAEAYDRGKTVECKVCGFTNIYDPHNLKCGMVDQNRRAVSANEILHGTWYIKEESV
jgi:hypothetical protein